MFRKLLSTPTEQVGRASRFLIFQVKLWSHCAKLLRKNRSGQQAAALAYQTIFGLVPLAIVTLLIFQLFPAYSDIGNKIKDFIYDQANLSAFESPEEDTETSGETVKLTEHLDEIIARFFEGTKNKGGITLFSLLIVIWAALALLSTIEKAFNNIWHVGRGRNFLNRMINYWALLTLGPLLIGVGIYLATQYSALSKIHKTLLSNVAPVVSSFVVATVTFFLLYFLLPNTKVKAKAAIWGATIAALVWVVAKGLFSYCVTELGLYSTIYGVLALVPITVLWVFITWLIVLFGLQLTFTTQHLKSLDAAEIAAARRRESFFIANATTAINIVREIANAFEKNNAPVEAAVVLSKLNIPAEFGEKILDHLIDSNLIAKTSEPKVGFIPARDPDNIRLSDVGDVVEKAAFAQSPVDQPEVIEQIKQSQRESLDKYNLKQILSSTEKQDAE